MTTKIYNTRIAPSPTGDFHIGTARTAYFNWLIARSTGGRFSVRIDDTDQNRSSDEFVKPIYDSLNWLGLDYDSNFQQSDRYRLGVYKSYCDALISANFAYKDNDSGVYRLRWNDEFPRTWKDNVCGTIAVSNDDVAKINDLVIMRSDDNGNLPLYHFASVVDDYENDTNFIVRGVDHISNTSRQIAIWSAINMATKQSVEIPEFAHVGLLFHQGKKISKRDGAASMLTYKNNGFNPDAMLNFLLRLGWSPTKDDKSTAIITKDQALSMFLSQGHMRAANPNVDFLKLDSFDRKYKAMIIKKVNNI